MIHKIFADCVQSWLCKSGHGLVVSRVVSSQEMESRGFEHEVQSTPIKFCTVAKITFLKVRLIRMERTSY